MQYTSLHLRHSLQASSEVSYSTFFSCAASSHCFPWAGRHVEHRRLSAWTMRALAMGSCPKQSHALPLVKPGRKYRLQANLFWQLTVPQECPRISLGLQLLLRSMLFLSRSVQQSLSQLHICHISSPAVQIKGKLC
jgi:hypothetical protein